MGRHSHETHHVADPLLVGSINRISETSDASDSECSNFLKIDQYKYERIGG